MCRTDSQLFATVFLRTTVTESGVRNLWVGSRYLRRSTCQVLLSKAPNPPTSPRCLLRVCSLHMDGLKISVYRTNTPCKMKHFFVLTSCNSYILTAFSGRLRPAQTDINNFCSLSPVSYKCAHLFVHPEMKNELSDWWKRSFLCAGAIHFSDTLR